MKNKLTDIYRYTDLIYDLFGINVYFIDESFKVKYQNSFKFTPISLYPSESDFYQTVLAKKNELSLLSPLLFRSNLEENFGIVKITENEYMIVGPVLFRQLSFDEIKGIFYDNNIWSNHEQHTLYYDSLSVLLREKFVIILKMLMFQMSEDCSFEMEDLVTSHEPDTQDSLGQIIETESITNRFELEFHHNMETEQKLLNAVRKGRSDLVVEHFQGLTNQNNGILSKKSRLRSAKNQCIAAVTLGTRSAIEGGLNKEIAFSVSDNYIQYLEDKNDITDLQITTTNALCSLAEKVYEHSFNNYSKVIVDSQHFILEHIFEEINVQTVSNHLNISPNYLSKIFKLEIGMSLYKYILTKKIEEAQNIIKHTNMSFTEISSALNFSDQSHFTKKFKMITGITPKQYKRSWAL